MVFEALANFDRVNALADLAEASIKQMGEFKAGSAEAVPQKMTEAVCVDVC